MFDSDDQPRQGPSGLTRYNATKPTAADLPVEPTFHRSPYSNGAGGMCVEVAFLTDGPAKGGVVLRDSTHPDGPTLGFSEQEYLAFVFAIDDGHLRRA
ncbi:DUF397 domain-containing protein [Frankia sp. AgB1.9]|uniref:DUF397 domain-containing protein n=1 Tax=unclassified Frankia TaxID=2632575 RepID=UPI0019344358|nr:MULTISPECIES: DUF397 domain-containing protein [unclassified Frankia]MBL7493120.1 DUF397 domain-containing protein [Frankia sp. AgW1.1]MBL7550472.1 DUF397 domain-containing protein [Frankia sp. AgB1.9]MBL7624331.1 DUF397 domain-containing protein [Frankia sp. AgB1.8]